MIATLPSYPKSAIWRPFFGGIHDGDVQVAVFPAQLGGQGNAGVAAADDDYLMVLHNGKYNVLIG